MVSAAANQNVGKALTFPAVILYLLFGILFIFGSVNYPNLRLLLLPTGVIFLIGALANFVNTRRFAA
jgi:hypothetical protein